MTLLTLPPFSFILFTLFIIPCYLSLPIPDAATIQPLTQNPSSSSQGTIPAFPEQADVARCPLSLSDEHFNGIKNACSSKSNKHSSSDDDNNELHRSRCCPVLAAWLYSAYSATALGGLEHGHTSSYDMPLLPDDSETCESDFGKALKVRGIELFQPNETCDLVYCYCGIRLHPLSCPESFKLTHSGNLVGDESVKRLETNCLSSSSSSSSSRNGVNGFPGLGGCSKCLHSLYLLRKKTSNSSKSGDRTTKIHNKDCELMGLTWLLAKNRNAYIHTVTLVLRALMLNPDGSDPQSCTLNSDGMPLAVDSSELYDQSSSIKFQAPIFLVLVIVMHFILLST